MNNYSKMMRLLGKYNFEGESKPYMFKGKLHPKSECGNNRFIIDIYPIHEGPEMVGWECYQKDDFLKEIYMQKGSDPFELFKQAIQRVLDN